MSYAKRDEGFYNQIAVINSNNGFIGPMFTWNFQKQKMHCHK